MKKSGVISKFIFMIIQLTIALVFSYQSAMAQTGCSYSDTDPLTTEKKNCLAKTGRKWDCKNHKCIYDQATETAQDSYAQCEGIEDDSQRKACMDSVALGASVEDGMETADHTDDAKKSAELLGWANLIWGSLNGGSTSNCMSTKIMKYTGLAQTAAELYAYFFLSDRVSELQKDYANKTIAKDNYDAQREAFKYLKKEQETIANVAKQKKIIYTVAAAGYTAAAGLALYETAMMYTGKIVCNLKTDGGKLACAQVLAKSGGDKGSDIKESNTSDTISDAAKADKASFKNIDLNAVKTSALESAKDMISWQELANQAKAATSTINFTKAKEEFQTLSEDSKQNVIYNLNNEVYEAQNLEVAIVNTSTRDANYKTYIEEVIKKWAIIAKKATEIGDEELATKATKKIEAWEAKLKEAGVSFNINIFNIFTPEQQTFKRLNNAVAERSIVSAKDDFDAYISFTEWNNYNTGKLSSFNLNTYRAAAINAPKIISFGLINFKLALINMIRINALEEAHASGAMDKIGNLAGGMAIGALKTYALKFALCTIAPRVSNVVSGWLQTPPAVAIMSSASAMVNFKLANIATNEQNQAEKNARIITGVLNKFEMSQMAFCPEGRDDISNPQCYCYTKTGEQNSNRTNSETCQALWAEQDQDYFIAGGKYDSESAGGCAYINGKYDLECKCKSIIDTNSGANACMKTTLTASELQNLNTNGLANTVGTIDKLVASTGNGDIATGSLDTALLANAAQAQKDINDAMVKNLNTKLKSKGKAPINLNSENAMNKMINSVLPKGELRSSLIKRAKLQSNSSGNQSLSPEAKKAMEDAIKKTGIQYQNSLNITGNTNDQYSYLSNESASGKNGGKVIDDNSFMNKKYQYNNEIHNNKEASLFEIISKRYTISGMKKLFGDK